MKGIDVSRWQGKIDFKKVKKYGIDFVIIKCGGSDAGFYKDRNFIQNYNDAKANGLAVGCYYFVGKKCTSLEAGVEDAKRCYKIIKGLPFDMPIFIDVESTSRADRIGTTEATIGFCRYLENLGYWVGVYASDISGYKERLVLDRLTPFTLWVAKYSKNKPTYVKDYHIWQYSSKGLIEGISGYVDLDVTDIDYPTLIKKAHKNGY